MENKLERRYFETRFKSDGSTLYGYASKFNIWTDLGYIKEKIAPGAFTESIKKDDIRALINHDSNLLLGRTKSETLLLWEDEVGLAYSLKLPGTSYASDLKESVKRGDLSGNSFSFRIQDEKWDDDHTSRTVVKAKLYDISPVTYPQYESTSLSLRHNRGGTIQERLTWARVTVAKEMIRNCLR